MEVLNKKKVVHLSTVHHPFDTRIFHKECVSLAKAGYDVTLIVAVEDERQEEIIDDVKLVYIRKHSGRIKRMTLSAWKLYLRAKNEQATVYHFHDPELMWVGYLLKQKGNQVIYDVHEDYLTAIQQKDYLSQGIKRIVSGIYKKVEVFFTKKMAYCLAEKYYQELYPKGQQILNYPILNEKVLQRPISVPENKHVIYTGNVTEVRGAYLHAQIPKFITGAHVYFYGKTDNDVANRMEQEASGLSHHLHVTGRGHYVNREIIDEAYATGKYLAGMAIFPKSDHYLRKELTKFFEYMTAGIPIVCSNFPVWESFIKKYNCGLVVDPNDPPSWGKALDKLMNNHTLYIELASNGRQAVIEKLNWENEADKLIQWYEQLINEKEVVRDE